MSGRQGKIRQFLWFYPTIFLGAVEDRFKPAIHERTEVAMQGDPIDGVAVLYSGDFFKVADCKFCLFKVFPHQGQFRGFPGFQTAAGKLPQVGPDTFWFALLDKDPAILFENTGGHFNKNCFCRRIQNRPFCHEIKAESLAISLYGTDFTAWIFGNTDKRSQFHQRLVEFTGFAVGQQIPGLSPDKSTCFLVFNRLGKVEKPGKDTLNIGINQGILLVKGNAHDSAGSVLSYSGQFEELIVVCWEFTAVFGYKDIGTLDDISGP